VSIRLIKVASDSWRRFLEAWLTNDPDALTRELADDVVFMPPGQEPARGKAAVRARGMPGSWDEWPASRSIEMPRSTRLWTRSGCCSA
jgi:ketosteroid isomerase-like protein